MDQTVESYWERETHVGPITIQRVGRVNCWSFLPKQHEVLFHSISGLCPLFGQMGGGAVTAKIVLYNDMC